MGKRSTLLTARKITIPGSLIAYDGNRTTWFTPIQYLKDTYHSVLEVVLFDTSSSSGNGSGYFLQRCGHNIYAIDFHQENNLGLTLHTGKAFAHCLPKDYKKFKESLPAIYNQLYS